MAKKRLNVGLLITEIENSFTKSICDGAVLGAKELDANLFLFPGRYIDAEYADIYRTRFEYQNNCLFDYASICDFDVILISLGTIGTNMDLDHRRKFLEKFKDIPVVLLTSKMDGYSSVCFDNMTGFKESIRHLIRDHKCQKIGFVSGPLSNQDALERLSTYKKVLEENEIRYVEKRVVYGNFSEYSTDVVRRLLNLNPDLDAVVFANDMMAIGGYSVFEERNITVGRDLMVVGFDDAPCATSLEPNLSTTRADALDLGYKAIMSLPDILAGEKKEIIVDSVFVPRESCGCRRKSQDLLSVTHDGLVNNTEDVLTSVYQYLFENNVNQPRTERVKERIKEIIYSVRDILLDAPDIFRQIDQFSKAMKTVNREQLEPYTRMEKVFVLYDRLYRVLMDGMTDSKKKDAVCDAYHVAYQDTVKYTKNQIDERQKDEGWLNAISTTFTRDILNFAIGDDRAYYSVVDKMSQLFFKSVYLCIFDEHITHRKDEQLKIPEYIRIKSYLKDQKIECLEENEQSAELNNLICRLYENSKERVTVVVTILYSTVEQYGLLISEPDEFHLSFISPVSYQISSAVKTIELLKNKEIITAQLEKSITQIRESNAILEEISKSDELTQIYNRRGFLATVSHHMTHPGNLGKRAVMIYADMNNLKIINDQFGHDEGDYSLKLIAAILKETFESGIVGRFGGDEFAAYTIVDYDNPAKTIRKKISEITRKKNEGNGKPYYVSMCVGISEFICSESVDIQDIMDKADVDLYIEKRHKRSNILKQDDEMK